MTTLFTTERKCFVCGAVSAFQKLGSTNSFGSSDLDLRSAPMKRYTMDYWIQECPQCGYVSEDISDFTMVSLLFLTSEAYRTCDSIQFVKELAKKFYRNYMICLQEKNPVKAFYAILHAAWVCDDAEDQNNAKHCRELAIPLITNMIELGSGDKETLLLMKADLLRRAGKFEQLITEYKDLEFSKPLLNQIRAFQIEKAKQEDTKCYRVADVNK